MPQSLGSADLVASIAPAGHTNAGNWAAEFTPQVLGVSLPRFECYRIVIHGGPPGSTFTVYVSTRLYDSVYPGDTNSWDPHQSLKLVQGDSVSFYWNTGAGSAPEVWLYLQGPDLL